MAKSYSWSAILKHLKAGTECACLAVFETCRSCIFWGLVFDWIAGSSRSISLWEEGVRAKAKFQSKLAPVSC